MLPSLTLLLVCQLAGEAVARALGLPLPGPVLGMVLLLALLMARGRASRELVSVSSALLRHLSLLFVPAGVGMVTELHQIGQDWVPIGPSLVVSTVLGMAAAGLVMQALLRRLPT